jgi:hypothetical protein
MTGAAPMTTTTDLLGKVTDVQQTLSYGSGKMGRTFLRLGLTALAACGVLAWLQPPDFNMFEWAMTYFGLVVGAACALYGLDRWLRPKPLLVLSPKGVQITIDTLKTFLIPWHEVKGVEKTDITGTWRGRTVTVTGVTVVLVTRAFYEAHIHVDSFLLRGPGWDFHFIPKTDPNLGEIAQVALHHDQLPATAIELREAVTFRWNAFRDAPPADRTPATGPRIFGGFRRK